MYARAAGEDEAVCAAIEEHHRPREAGGELPGSEAGAVLSIADKADTLAVAFERGLEPTGSRDPFGLRRAAAGVVAIALDRGYALDLPALVGERAAEFLLDRLEPLLLEEGVTVEELRAARGAGALEPVEVAGRARELHAFAGPGRDRRPRRLRPLRAHRRCDAAGPGRRGAPDRPGRARAWRRRSAGRRATLEQAAALAPVVDRLLRRRPGHGPATRRCAQNRLTLVANVRRRTAPLSGTSASFPDRIWPTCPSGSRSTSCPTPPGTPPRASARAAQSQFEDTEIEMIRHARVQNREQLARALESATGRRAAVFYTLVDPALREAVVEIGPRAGSSCRTCSARR